MDLEDADKQNSRNLWRMNGYGNFRAGDCKD